MQWIQEVSHRKEIHFQVSEKGNTLGKKNCKTWPVKQGSNQ